MQTKTRRSIGKVAGVVLVVGLVSCQAPKYAKVETLQSPKGIRPEVVYTQADGFDFNSLHCIAVGDVVDQSSGDDFPALNKIKILQFAIHGHLAPKNYRDVELSRVAFIRLKTPNLNPHELLERLGCDALLTGAITIFNNNYYLAYSVTSVGLRLRLTDKTGTVVWSSAHVARNDAGAIPLSPLGIATGMFLAAANTQDEIAFQMVDAVVRRSLNALPERTPNDFHTLVNTPPGDYEKPQIESEDQQIINNAEVEIQSGNYEGALTLAESEIAETPGEANPYYLAGRASLLLRRLDLAEDYLLEAITRNDSQYVYFDALGVTYAKRKKLDLAIAAFNKAIVLNKKDGFAYFNVGVILESKDLLIQSSTYYYSAGTSGLLNDDYERAHQALMALRRLKEVDKEIMGRYRKLEKLMNYDWQADRDEYVIQEIEP
jgi:tetratricopeptide (TPR) repeat protein